MSRIQQAIRISFAVFLCTTQLYAQNDQVMRDLGHRLFYDADLSINGTMSCATCHEQRRAFTDGNRMHPGALGDPGKRNVPGLANVRAFKNLTWANNHLSGLAEQSLMPIRGTDPIEMGMNGYEDEIAKRLSKNECYQKLFSLAFPNQHGAITLENVTQALERFEKTLISDNSLYDQMAKAHKPLPLKEAREGEKLFFGAAKCNSCHSTPLFSDDNFHHVQPQNRQTDNPTTDYGLSDVTGNPKDKNFFRTPSLRNAAMTSPYWHDGSADTLRDAIRKHNLKINQTLSERDIDTIIAFIDTLSDSSFITNPKFSKPSPECPY
ncbi:cytochrome c peroxidase [uncultured Sulfuricurvum sp.]|uniref:cytochrome-c peroxidase n=1 Tax=uncultured Sulfuricurvum sp. TaxID=430693 RepID=UPI0026273C5C|nr:cytochrome c peroxidase [uncultured Sulfuricurvum sp.]